VSTVVPSLTLRSLLRSSASRVGLEVVPEVTTGLTPTAQAMAIASAAVTTPVMLVVPTDNEVEAMTSDARFFYAAVEGLSDPELSRAVMPFPSLEVDPYRAITPHLDVASARAKVLSSLARGSAQIVIASAAALLPRVSSPQRILEATRDIVLGDTLSPNDLGALLADAGFVPEDPVDEHGEFCIRGGVVDFFPAGEGYPIRVEFLDDLIESLRQFDPGTQRSVTMVDRVAVIPLRENFESVSEDLADARSVDRDSNLLEFIAGPTSMRTFVSHFEECERQATILENRVNESYVSAKSRGENPSDPQAIMLSWTQMKAHLEEGSRFETLGLDDPDSFQQPIACQPTRVFHGRLGEWVKTLQQDRRSGETQLVVTATPGRAERIAEMLQEYEVPAVLLENAQEAGGGKVLVVTGELSRGFRLPDGGLQIYAESDLFDEERRVRDRRKSVSSSFLSDLRDLKTGDHVVHVDHGIGEFVGLAELDVGGTPHELMQLRYASGDKLFVPVEYLDLIQKHTGTQNPVLDRLGGTNWERAKTRVKRAMREMAGELLKLYAARKAVAGHAFGPDTHWQSEFEAAFDYDLTSDQLTAVTEIKRDLEMPAPMDRLLCGDVGYGKTEVALRAAFKAVMDGKQVALLAPTTVLAFQHSKTIKERFAAFPVRIDLISRFRNRTDQKVVLSDLFTGKVDVIVGTHRLLSRDVQFHDLGLLIVDEEQRFGVAHKERIKQLKQEVDVLTLTATPIPRTLNMSLMGIRDMSVIETPPKDRLSIQTNVVKFDATVIVGAIRNELQRKGQVYFVHNRIHSIYTIANLIKRLVPEARLIVAHGQSSESDLERAMIGFVDQEYDVLLSTTIIENGLDIPNVNTIIINHAERYGLAQLYQLRGRVGRSNRRAYAYLLIPPEDSLSRVAQQRLSAIKEFSDLGSGFRVAALDLEIRGAGNLLGAEQSGQIDAVGFDMYVKLLERTVLELKGEATGEERRAAVALGVELRVDGEYVSGSNQRLALYRRVALARDDQELTELLDELADRYGPVPQKVLRLVEFGRIRLMADRLGIESIEREKHLLVIKFRSDSPLNPARLVELVEARNDVTLTPPAVITVNLEAGDPSGRKRTSQLINESTSWWTRRATSGLVSKGFSKQKLSNSGHLNRDDKVLTQIGGLLAELSGGA